MSEIRTELQFMTLEEVAKHYNLSLPTLRRWCAERRFPIYKISNRIRVAKDEWESWVQKFHVEEKNKE